jgi:hypothetical protein
MDKKLKDKLKEELEWVKKNGTQEQVMVVESMLKGINIDGEHYSFNDEKGCWESDNKIDGCRLVAHL